jgi:DinB superfamily
MDQKLAAHYARLRHIRESFAEANERLVARLRGVTDEAAQHVPEAGGWSVAQIGLHVARVSNSFAGLISGERPGARPLPADFKEHDWTAIAQRLPDRLEASPAFHPPPGVTRHDAIAELEASGVRIGRALDMVTPERGAAYGISSPIVGEINVYQIGEWATAHVIRHNRQAKRILEGV